MREIGRHAPADAVKFVEALPGGAEANPALYVATARGWAETDGAAAVDWFIQTTADKTQLGDVVRTWTSKEPAQALAWAEQQENAATQKEFLKMVTQNLATSPDMPKAVAVIETIKDPQLREATLVHAAMNWMSHPWNRAAAVRWVEGSSLPAARKRELVERARTLHQ